MVIAVLRALGSAVALVAIYYLLPLDHFPTWASVTVLVAAFVALIALIGFQARWIIRSRFPTVRAVEALATSLPLFLLLFAIAYLVMDTISASNFNQHLTHTGSLYFTVTTFGTVGPGDIVALTETARVVVMGQVIADVVVLGIGAKIILGAVRRGHQHRPEDAGAGQPSN